MLEDRQLISSHGRLGSLESALVERSLDERVARWLAGCWGTDVVLTRLWIDRVFPRGNGGLTLQLGVESQSNGGPVVRHILGGYLLAAEEPWGDEHPSVLQVADLRLTLFCFPHDPRLALLGTLSHSEDVVEILKPLARNLGLNSDAPIQVRSEVLGYRLERRCVLKYSVSQEADGGPVFQMIGKAYRPSRFSGVAFRLGLIENLIPQQRPQCIASTLAVAPLKGLHLMEFVEGTSLHEMANSTQFASATQATGRLVRQLYEQSVGGLPHHSRDDEVKLLRRWIRLLKPIFPAWELDFKRTLHTLVNEPTADPPLAVCIHRDFYDKQIVHTPKRTVILDWDNLAVGDPCLDVGNFQAHLFLRALQNVGATTNIRDGQQAFLQAYGRSGEDFDRQVRWWEAATLLRLAGIYALRNRWRHLTPVLLDRSRQLVNA